MTTQTTTHSSKVTTIEELYLEQLRDLFSAENQLIAALPKMAQAATNEKLRDGFEEHLEQTREHAQRLEEIFSRINQKPGGTTCKAMKGLVAEGEESIQNGTPGPVLDAALIAAAQRVEHYEMAGYGTVVTLAKQLGDKESVKPLHTTLEEEKATDKKLTALAESSVNKEAEKAA